jgi:hypothetical protein
MPPTDDSRTHLRGTRSSQKIMPFHKEAPLSATTEYRTYPGRDRNGRAQPGPIIPCLNETRDAVPDTEAFPITTFALEGYSRRGWLIVAHLGSATEIEQVQVMRLSAGRQPAESSTGYCKGSSTYLRARTHTLGTPGIQHLWVVGEGVTESVGVLPRNLCEST